MAACQTRIAVRYHIHLEAVLAALTWVRLKLRHAVTRALERFSIVNAKLRAFLQLVARLFATNGLGCSLQ